MIIYCLNIDVVVLKLQSTYQVKLKRLTVCLVVTCLFIWCPADLWSVTGVGHHTEQAAGCRHRSLRSAPSWQEAKRLISTTNNRVQTDSKSNHWKYFPPFVRWKKNHCVDFMLKVNKEVKWNVNLSREHLAGGLITTGTEAALLSHLWRVHAASCSDSDLL